MTGSQIGALSVMVVFYIAYFTKTFIQSRKGIKTDQIGKGAKPHNVLCVELFLKIATFAIIPVELISICGNFGMLRFVPEWIGIACAGCGVGVFIIAMMTMRDSWRAGIPEKDRTELVTTGIYRFSRNPAFLGFDLMYIGLLLAYFDLVHLLFCGFAVLMLHLQILQEEEYLKSVFGDAYLEYKKRTGRYFLK